LSKVSFDTTLFNESNQHSQQYITLLLQRVTLCTVGVEVRAVH
jgi:hypothetical protein